MADNLITATDQDFDDVISGDTPVLVDFWAEWCGPCRMVAPVVEKLADDYSGRLTVAKLNVDDNPQTAMAYDVMSIPTLILYKNGEEKKRIIGARPEHALVAELSEYLTDKADA